MMPGGYGTNGGMVQGGTGPCGMMQGGIAGPGGMGPCGMMPGQMGPGGMMLGVGPGPITMAPTSQFPMGENNRAGQQQSVTNVVINSQPTVNNGAGGNQIGFSRPWFSPLFGCLDSIPTCLCTLFCPCIYLMMTYNKFGEGCSAPLCICPPHMSLMALRIYVRSTEDIQGSICNDCLMSFYCFSCVLCQMSREFDFVLKYRNRRIGSKFPM